MTHHRRCAAFKALLVIIVAGFILAVSLTSGSTSTNASSDLLSSRIRSPTVLPTNYDSRPLTTPSHQLVSQHASAPAYAIDDSNAFYIAEAYINGSREESFAYVYDTYLNLSTIIDEDYWYISIQKSPVGDVNRDGYNDFLVSDPEGTRGLAYLYSGRDHSILMSRQGDQWNTQGFGYAQAGAGDVNNDGYPDIILGDYSFRNGPRNFAGKFYVHSGKTGQLLYSEVGPDRQHFGWAVTGVGDLNGDGYDEVLVTGAGDPFAGTRGIARVYSGIDWTLIYTYRADAADAFGFAAIEALGDIDSDGVPDFAMGNIFDYVRVFSGRTGVMLYEVRGSGQHGEYFGYSLSSVPDVDNDGANDLMVGIPIFSGWDASGSGKVHIYSGSNGSLISELFGERAFDEFGIAVAAVRDTNGDDIADYVVGASGYDGGARNSGRAYVFSGASKSLISVVDPPTPRRDGNFGYEVAAF